MKTSKRENIKETVSKLVKKHKTRDPYKLLESLGIKLQMASLKNINGFYIKYRNVKTIVINSNIEEDYQRFVLAHELGHAILHPNENIQCLRENVFCKTMVFEVQANKFAPELLIEDDILEYKEYSLSQIASIKRVPVEILELKLS